MNKTIVTVFSLLISTIIFNSCTKKYHEIKWDYTDVEVVGDKAEKEGTIDIDIYIDATTSMQGFAVSKTSIYGLFLDELEASVQTQWSKANIKFYMFGEKRKLINHDEFLKAQDDLNFYNEPGIFKETRIDSVIDKADPKRLTVVITDLFQHKTDANSMVISIKDKCFKKNIQVGIAPIESDFIGKVYDVPEYPSGYTLNTTENNTKRPFYILMFGAPYNMEFLFEKLKDKNFTKEEHFFLFSKNLIKSFKVDELIKDKTSKSVNKINAKNPQENSFDFSMKKDGKEAKFNLVISLRPNTRCADFDETSIEVEAFKKSITNEEEDDPESNPTTDIYLEGVKREGNKLTATVILKNADPVGNYSYLVYLKPNTQKGIKAPLWINKFDTESPIPGTPSASKTYNLKTLVTRLLDANTTISPPSISKFYINIYKR